MKILITGSKGFVGGHLKRSFKGHEILEYNRGGKLDTDVDVIYHCAGVMRPKDPNEYYNTNFGLTKKILQHMELHGDNPPFIMLSTTQVNQKNDYAISKLMAEFEVINYDKGVIYRLPNTFGEGAKPNYNSVVSTWLYNIKHDKPIRMDNPDYELEIAYISDVIQNLQQFNDTQKVNFIKPTYKIKLGDLSDTIHDIRDGKEQKTELGKKLVKTYDKY